MVDAPKTASTIPRTEARGAEIPVLGFGTWELTGATARRMTEAALRAGYRHLDTARAYGNEAQVGQALETSDVDRADVFLATKIWPDDYRPADFRAAADDSLDRLGTDRVDLLLLHWPRFGGTGLEATVEALVEAREAGKARHVGVCNFTTDLLERADAVADETLVVNQVEYHPYLDQDPVLEAVRARGMALTAYSPLAHGRVVEDETLAALGLHHGKSAAQVALRWLIQQPGVNAIPRTSDPDHVRENFDLFDFQLSGEEMRRIAGLARPDGRVIDPAGLAPDWD